MRLLLFWRRRRGRNHWEDHCGLLQCRTDLRIIKSFFLLAELEGLGASDDLEPLELAFSAEHDEGDLLGGLGLLSENGFGLAAVALLLHVVTPLSQHSDAILALSVSRHLMHFVVHALREFAVSPHRFGENYHFLY